ncbi:MAG: hypothetical protein ACQEUZ_15975 [Pseudomonadota bacterium]
MNGALEKIGIHHDFAPGAAPGTLEVLLHRLLDAVATPEVSLIAVGVVAPLGLWILVQAQLRPRRRRGAGPRRRAGRRRPAGAADFAALRRARMPALPEAEARERA